jgi:hypothetical protein
VDASPPVDRSTTGAGTSADEHPASPAPQTTAHAVNLNNPERITAILPNPACLFYRRPDDHRAAQNRIPAPQPPKKPPFDAAPPQPKMPHPDNIAASPSATTAMRARRHPFVSLLPATFDSTFHFTPDTSPRA